MEITFQDIKNSPDIRVYIEKADETLKALGYTEHSYAHVNKVAYDASMILEKLGYSKREAELARIAGYLHDIGNIVNRIDHAQSGAVIAFRILDNLGMPAEEVATIVTAIGNHDEGTAFAVNALAAALILADKSDVRRTRVRNQDMASFDIHDRVNYAVKKSGLLLDPENKTILLDINIDTAICSVMDYFEIFLQRMLLCRRAADFFGLQFKLTVNGASLL